MKNSYTNFFIPFLILFAILISFSQNDYENFDTTAPNSPTGALLVTYDGKIISDDEILLVAPDGSPLPEENFIDNIKSVGINGNNFKNVKSIETVLWLVDGKEHMSVKISENIDYNGSPTDCKISLYGKKNVPVVTSHDDVPVVTSHAAAPVVTSHAAAPVITSQAAVPVVTSQAAVPVVTSQAAAYVPNTLFTTTPSITTARTTMPLSLMATSAMTTTARTTMPLSLMATSAMTTTARGTPFM